MDFKIYKEDEVIAVGTGSLVIGGLLPDTTVKAGEYQVVRVNEDNIESKRVNIPSFKTLGKIEVTTSPKTSRATAGETGSRNITVVTGQLAGKDVVVDFELTGSAGLTISELGLLEWTEDTPKGTYITTIKVNGSKVGTHVLTLT